MDEKDKIFNPAWSSSHISHDYLSFSTALGAAYGTAKSGTGIAAMSVMRPELIMKSIIPGMNQIQPLWDFFALTTHLFTVVMAGIIAIYGLVVAVLVAGGLEESGKYTLYKWVSNFSIFHQVKFKSHDHRKKSMITTHYILTILSVCGVYIWEMLFIIYQQYYYFEKC